jgi:7-carboxy-7-deazaguanine synthase
VLIETGGSEDVSTLPAGVHVILDVKCPDSKMSYRNLKSNYQHLEFGRDELKFVIASRSDFDWAVQFIDEQQLATKAKILLSPAWGLVKPEDLVSWLLESSRPYRLNLQIHKYIWHPRAKGV